MARKGILDGIKVLDFTRALAGSYATRLLCDMGGRILKIEGPEIGDGIRYTAVDHPAVGKYMLPTLSPMFIFANAGKESICMDLKKPESIELIKRLVEKVDVVTENFTAHVMRSLGIGYDDLIKIKPDLVMCSLSGFGQEGPLADHVSNDTVGQAMGGMAYITGETGGYPCLAGNGIADTATGTMAAMSILAALLNRERTGEGEYIDVSMMDTVMAVDGTSHPYYAATRGEFKVERNHRTHFLLSPWGVFKGPNNRYFAMLSPWPRLCEAMGRPELIEHPDFVDNNTRLRNRDKVHAVIEEWLQSFPDDEAAFRFIVDNRLAAGPVLDPWETQRHPQLEGREMVREIPYPNGMTIPTTATSPHFRNRPINVGRAPFIGEHNRSLLQEFLGLGEEELEQLHESGALFEHPITKALREGALE